MTHSTRPVTRSPQRCLAIIFEIARSGGGLTLAEISGSLGAPKTSVLDLLRRLVAERFLLQSDTRYILGPETYVLAHSIVSQQSLARVARPILVKLAERTGATAILTTLAENQSEIIHLEKVESCNALRYVPQVGDRRPLYCTASGVLLLAHMPEEQSEAYIRKVKLKPMASNTVSTLAALRRRMEVVRRTGMSVSIDQSVEGVASIAAPIYNLHNKVVGVLAVALPSLALSDNPGKLCDQMQFAAEVISRLMGCTTAYASAGASAYELNP